MKLPKKDKRNGIIATFIFHSILIISFFYLGLKYKDPPPAEEGISINFGNSFSGINEQAESVDDKIEPIEENIIEQQIKSNEEKITVKANKRPDKGHFISTDFKHEKPYLNIASHTSP